LLHSSCWDSSVFLPPTATCVMPSFLSYFCYGLFTQSLVLLNCASGKPYYDIATLASFKLLGVLDSGKHIIESLQNSNQLSATHRNFFSAYKNCGYDVSYYSNNCSYVMVTILHCFCNNRHHNNSGLRRIY